MEMYDIIVVGAGPAGASVMEPLVDTGLNIAWLDAGDAFAPRERSSLVLSESRQGRPSPKGVWAEAAPSGTDHTSPKIRLSPDAQSFRDYGRVNAIETRNFDLVGSLASGGLSRVWGAFAPTLRPQDLGAQGGWADELADDYAALAARIGISGDASDDLSDYLGAGIPLQPPLDLSGSIRTAWDRYSDLKAKPDGFKAGRARLAVRSEPLDGQNACDLRGSCMWGCGQGAVYDAVADVQALATRPGVTYRPATPVLAATRHTREDGSSGFSLDVATPAGGREQLNARRLVLAAGALVSTKLALSLMDDPSPTRPLLTNPSVAFALWDPRRLGTALDDRFFGGAQLCFRQAIPDETALSADDHVFGMLYDGQSFPASEIVGRMPLSRPGGIRLVRTLLPGLVVGLYYFSSDYSRSRVNLERRGDTPILTIDGGYRDELTRAFKTLSGRLYRAFRAMGLVHLPFSTELHRPGAECHLGGTLAFGRDTNAEDGELIAVPGVHIADGAVLPRLPAKHPTFTIMANARRVGRAIAVGAANP